jgi:putative flavoprotein involved in K+ transport
MNEHEPMQRDEQRPVPHSERCETLIIGAGQAGLAVAYHLARQGRSSVLLDANARVGDNWRRHWDSLRLYSPARYDGLPGMPFPAPPWAFPTKDEVADFLEAYAETHDLDVRTGVRVGSLRRRDGRFVASTDHGDYEADDVVVASGTYGGPYRPAFAADLDPTILQLHSSAYRNPSQLTHGPVLVVGASHSGADIAVEVAAGHPTVLAGRSNGEIPFELEGRPMRGVFPVLWFAWGHVATLRTPIGRKMRPKVRTHGGPLLRYRERDLAAAGVERVTERVVGVHDGLPVLDGGRVLDVANVIWCTGFRQDFTWIDLPVVGDDGWPLEQRGVVPSAEGLYFAGLAFQSSFRSMLIGGVGHDAAHVAGHIVARHHGRGAAATSDAGVATVQS